MTCILCLCLFYFFDGSCMHKCNNNEGVLCFFFAIPTYINFLSWQGIKNETLQPLHYCLLEIHFLLDMILSSNYYTKTIIYIYRQSKSFTSYLFCSSSSFSFSRALLAASYMVISYYHLCNVRGYIYIRLYIPGSHFTESFKTMKPFSMIQSAMPSPISHLSFKAIKDTPLIKAKGHFCHINKETQHQHFTPFFFVSSLSSS